MMEIDLENIKQELAAMEDFNMNYLFNFFDILKRGYISIADL